jgi:hypothetical protein
VLICLLDDEGCDVEGKQWHVLIGFSLFRNLICSFVKFCDGVRVEEREMLDLPKRDPISFPLSVRLLL